MFSVKPSELNYAVKLLIVFEKKYLYTFLAFLAK